MGVGYTLLGKKTVFLLKKNGPTSIGIVVFANGVTIPTTTKKKKQLSFYKN
jgi:hypothetical protein